MKVPEDELRARRQLGTRYQNAQKKAAIDDQLRGLDAAMKILQERRDALHQESEQLKPARHTPGRGGA